MTDDNEEDIVWMEKYEFRNFKAANDAWVLKLPCIAPQNKGNIIYVQSEATYWAIVKCARITSNLVHSTNSYFYNMFHRTHLKVTSHIVTNPKQTWAMAGKEKKFLQNACSNTSNLLLPERSTISTVPSNRATAKKFQLLIAKVKLIHPSVDWR